MNQTETKNIGEAGQTLSFVTLEKIIGTPGEQGEVWKAHAKDFKSITFAVKISRIPMSPTDSDAYKRFKKEFVMLSEMRHPQIVKVYFQDEFSKDGSKYPFYVMEYLGDEVTPLEKSPLLNDPARARFLCIKAVFDTAAALQHLHHHAMQGCHLDIKGSNILIHRSGNDGVAVKLIDFGFATFLAAMQSKQMDMTKAGRMAQKTSSFHRAFPAKTEKHLDLWQLCYAVKRLLDGLSIPPGTVENYDEWPIDYAHYPRFEELLNEWANDGKGSAAEVGDVETFYDALQDLATASTAKSLGADLKGAIRFLAVPEIAMAARVCSAAHAIRIPPRRSVLYTERIARVLASPSFTALEYTRQLGFTHLVYPGALGTRFEHSVGVFDLAAHLVVRMSAYPAFRRVCSSPKDTLLFLLASLLHDVGHFPYAHQLEEFTEEDFSAAQWAVVKTVVAGHHARAKQILKKELFPLLKSQFELTNQDVDLILQIVDWDEKKGMPSSLKFLRGILDGVVDLDKLDYIERDAYHCGVPYGNFIDIERLFETMRIVKDTETGEPVLAFDQRGVGCLEQLVTARHQMYANVYWHRAVRSATVMFKHLFYIFQRIFPERELLEKLFFKAGSDDRLLLLLEEHLERHRRKIRSQDPNVEAAIHLARVVSGRNRRLYKAVVQCDHGTKTTRCYGEHSYRAQRGKAKKIFDILAAEGMWGPEAKRMGAHNVLIDCREDWWPPFETIQILNAQGKSESLEKQATTVKQLGESFRKQACKLRVFINVDVLKPEFAAKNRRFEVETVIRTNLEQK